MLGCRHCGSAVIDEKLHTEWHGKQDAMLVAVSRQLNGVDKKFVGIADAIRDS